MAGNGEFTISKERWAELEDAERSWILYDTFIQHRRGCEERYCKCELRFYKLERRKWLDKLLAVAAGAAAAIGISMRP